MTEQNQKGNETPEIKESDQFEIRKQKRANLLEQNIEPYVLRFGEVDDIKSIRERYQDLAPEAKTDDVVAVIGRLMFKRETGKLIFGAIQDGMGNRLQLMISQGEIGEEKFAEFKKFLDLGDFIWAKGKIVCSKTGELSVFVSDWKIGAKALRPMPVLHKDLNEEERVRRRYLDFITNKDSTKLMVQRSKIVESLRENYSRRNYIEIETPMIQLIHGGASARPFQTHINAFDLDVYMRISPELFLKRAVVGGLDRVFEINRNFRNEGADSSHSPEFSMLESYEAYSDYNGVADLTQDLVQQAALDVFGTQQLTLKDGSTYDVSGQWKRIDFYETISEFVGQKITAEDSIEDLMKIIQKLGLEKEALKGQKKEIITHGKLAELIFEHFEDELYEPTFVMDFPVETSPLVSQHRTKPGVAEKWDLFVRGFELATGYSELVDPVIQRERLTKQSLLAANGDEEAMQLDEDFLEALEFGMPPTGGMGMGIDRLVMTLTGVTSIRETIPFPLVKPQK